MMKYTSQGEQGEDFCAAKSIISFGNPLSVSTVRPPAFSRPTAQYLFQKKEKHGKVTGAEQKGNQHPPRSRILPEQNRNS